MNALTRPLMRYHGGKWKLAPWLIGHFPHHRIYVEPYGGGGASVLLRKARSYAEVYNDMDGEIVNLFRVVRDHGQQLLAQIYLTPFARDEMELAYLPAEDPIEQARRTLIRSYMGFGSGPTRRTTKGIIMRTGFRADSNKSGTTPARDWATYPNALVEVIERLRGVIIEHLPAVDVMENHDTPQTLHFVDPPYVMSTRAGTDSDYAHEMSDGDHVALSACLRALTGFVVLCGYPSALYDDLFGDWQRFEREHHADGARLRTECIWVNAAVSQQLCAGPLFHGVAS